MRSVSVRVLGWSTLLSICFVAGCGDSKPSVDSSGSSEATVKGVVKIDGVPATEGEIIFDPANYKRKDAKMRTAEIGKDGHYSVTTLTGTNQVSLGGKLAEKHQALQSQTREFDVQSGENTFDFDAKAK